LVSREYINSNPFQKIKKLETEDPEIVSFTKSELQLIKNTLPEYDSNLFLISQFIFYTFIRPAELTRLRIEHIDFTKKVISISGMTAKNKKTKMVTMPRQFSELLGKYNLNKFPKNFFIVSSGLKPGLKQIAPTRIAERWRTYADLFNIDKRKTIYNLKHTGVGMAIENNINIRALQLHLRHSSLEMTQIYVEQFNKIGGEEIEFNYPDF
jgi:integrase